MLLRLTALLLLSMTINSCGERERLITFPPGDYLSPCIVEGSDSKNSLHTISQDFKSKTVQDFIYSDVSNCSNTGTAENEPITSDISFIFSNEDLGDRVSYLTIALEVEGEPETSFMAFKFQNSKLLFSPSVSVLGIDPKKTFKDFISDPDSMAELTLIRKDLN